MKTEQIRKSRAKHVQTYKALSKAEKAKLVRINSEWVKPSDLAKSKALILY
jgi:hypothetical protein